MMDNLADQAARLFASVVSGGYCIGCGACTAVQSSQFEIRLNSQGFLQAQRDPLASKQPAKVLAVCPFSEAALNEDTIGQGLFGKTCKFHPQLGFTLSTWAGFVTEGDFRKNGSSGGVAKWLLNELLKLGLVDAVIQVDQHTPSETNPVLFRYRVFKKEDEIKTGSKSVYYPVEMSGVLKHIKQNPGRYAITGVPCFIKALRLLALHEPLICERIEFCIGLICGHLKSARYADMIGWQLGIPPKSLKAIDFRFRFPNEPANHKGIEVTAHEDLDGKSQTVLAKDLFGTNYNLNFFRYSACDFCDDVVAETADISIGDAWLPEYLGIGGGTSILVIRHPIIQRIIEEGRRRLQLELHAIPLEKVVQSQEGGFRDRREGLAYRLYLKEQAGQWHPPKRVQAENTHIDRKRQKIYRMRCELTQRSTIAFDEALRAGRFSVFERQLQPLITAYTRLYLPSWSLRIVKKVQSFFKGLKNSD